MHNNIFYDVYNTISKSNLWVLDYAAHHHTSTVWRSLEISRFHFQSCINETIYIQYEYY